jgi:hypothetical protein
VGCGSGSEKLDTSPSAADAAGVTDGAGRATDAVAMRDLAIIDSPAGVATEARPAEPAADAPAMRDEVAVVLDGAGDSADRTVDAPGIDGPAPADGPDGAAGDAGVDGGGADAGPPRLPAGDKCTAAAQCQSGACTDGICCSQSCAVCQSCTAPGGTCGDIPLGDPDNEPAAACAGNMACDGEHGCKLASGRMCSDAPACASRACVDGVCCLQTACGLCESCALAGSLGVCTNVRGMSMAGNPHCPGTCDGNGACRNDSIGISPVTFDFGVVPVGGKSAERAFQLTNKALTAARLAPATTEEFLVVATDCPAMTAPGATCSVTVRFQPISAGKKYGYLVVSDAGSAFLTGQGM